MVSSNAAAHPLLTESLQRHSMNLNNYNDLVPVKAGLYMPLSCCHRGDSALDLMALIMVFNWYLLIAQHNDRLCWVHHVIQC